LRDDPPETNLQNPKSTPVLLSPLKPIKKAEETKISSPKESEILPVVQRIPEVKEEAVLEIKKSNPPAPLPQVTFKVEPLVVKQTNSLEKLSSIAQRLSMLPAQPIPYSQACLYLERKPEKNLQILPSKVKSNPPLSFTPSTSQSLPLPPKPSTSQSLSKPPLHSYLPPSVTQPITTKTTSTSTTNPTNSIGEKTPPNLNIVPPQMILKQMKFESDFITKSKLKEFEEFSCEGSPIISYQYGEDVMNSSWILHLLWPNERKFSFFLTNSIEKNVSWRGMFCFKLSMYKKSEEDLYKKIFVTMSSPFNIFSKPTVFFKKSKKGSLDSPSPPPKPPTIVKTQVMNLQTPIVSNPSYHYPVIPQQQQQQQHLQQLINPFVVGDASSRFKKFPTNLNFSDPSRNLTPTKLFPLPKPILSKGFSPPKQQEIPFVKEEKKIFSQEEQKEAEDFLSFVSIMDKIEESPNKKMKRE
jgi:hypothetical protein